MAITLSIGVFFSRKSEAAKRWRPPGLPMRTISRVARPFRRCGGFQEADLAEFF
jgi:hypothetical protein